MKTPEGSNMIARGKRVQRATPGHVPNMNPTPEGSHLNVEGATPPGSDSFSSSFPGAALRALTRTSLAPGYHVRPFQGLPFRLT